MTFERYTHKWAWGFVFSLAVVMLFLVVFFVSGIINEALWYFDYSVGWKNIAIIIGFIILPYLIGPVVESFGNGMNRERNE